MAESCSQCGERDNLLTLVVLPAHHSEVVLCVLIIILCLNCVAAQDGGMCKRHIAFVLPSGICLGIATSASGRERSG